MLKQSAGSVNATALVVALLVGVAASTVQATGIGSSPLNAFDDAAHDVLLRSQPRDMVQGSLGINQSSDPRDFVTIVAIDERTIAELGAYNGGYPRSYHAQVVEQLLAAPPRVIAFDIGFFEPTADDAQLAAAFEHARSLPVPTTIVLSSVGLSADGQAVTRTPTGELAFDSALLPVPLLADKAQLALANIVPDDRGTIRSMPLVAYVQGVEQPTLGLAVTAAYLRRHNAYDSRGASSLEVAGRSIPLEGDAAVRINYFGPPSQPYSPKATFRVISFVDVLRGRIDPAVWRGGVVMIGALAATGLADDYWTPMSDQGHKMAGVEIHANVAGTLFSTRFLGAAPLALQVSIIVSLAVLMALLAANLGAPAIWIVPSLVLCVYVTGDALAFYTFGLLLPFSTPILAGLTSLSGTAVYRGSRRVSANDDPQATAQKALVENLRRAIESDQFVLYYQPKVECGSRRLAAVEALVRWQHRELGLIGPERFIGLAEESGLIAPLTRWVLNAAIAQLRAWLDVGVEIPIAVNLSAVDVQDSRIPAMITDLLARWNVPARLLTVEMTEGALLANPTAAIETLQQLERVGVLAALDDFGSGYSSLGYLKQFPVHELKIDRSLVVDIVREPRDQMIVRSTIELGHSLGMTVVAEGMEDEATMMMLDYLGCDLAQGYLISRPMPAIELAAWIGERDWSLPRATAA